MQVVEIELDDGGYKGMPFVLRSGETWIKNNGSDFFLDFSTHDVRNIKAIVSAHFTLQTSYCFFCFDCFTVSYLYT